MSYFARFGEKSVNEKVSENVKNLLLFNNHLQKQVSVQQEIFINYQSSLQKLEERKSYLMTLIQKSALKGREQIVNKEEVLIDNKSQYPFQSPKKHNKSRVKSISQFQENNNKIVTPKVMGSKLIKANKTVNKQAFSRSRIESKRQKSKQPQTNYLTNMNEYKHKDLIQQVATLMKQLNNLINRKQSQQAISMNKSLLMQSNTFMKGNNPSLLMQSNYSNKKNLSISQNSQHQFVAKYLSQLGSIQRLPSINNNQPTDQVINSLILNLQKQQSSLINKLQHYKNLQIQKIVKQNLQSKTLQNLRIIYNLNQKQSSKINNKQVKSTKDIIKFGYTDLMLQCIKQKHNKNH